MGAHPEKGQGECDILVERVYATSASPPLIKGRLAYRE
jgi:hypothetical protein